MTFIVLLLFLNSIIIIFYYDLWIYYFINNFETQTFYIKFRTFCITRWLSCQTIYLLKRHADNESRNRSAKIKLRLCRRYCINVEIIYQVKKIIWNKHFTKEMSLIFVLFFISWAIKSLLRKCEKNTHIDFVEN